MNLLVPLLVIVVVIALLFVFRGNGKKGKSLYGDVEASLVRLKLDRHPQAFFGFHTKDTDALYFVYEDDVFHLDYELSSEAKRAFEDEFRKTADSLGFEVSETSYGEDSARVLRVSLTSDEKKSAKTGYEFASRIFGIDQETELEFLP
ncbi:MAG: hypothetical protein R2684_16200 [Pyrinomonadaceae bacterium]